MTFPQIPGYPAAPVAPTGAVPYQPPAQQQQFAAPPPDIAARIAGRTKGTERSARLREMSALGQHRLEVFDYGYKHDVSKQDQKEYEGVFVEFVIQSSTNPALVVGTKIRDWFSIKANAVGAGYGAQKEEERLKLCAVALAGIDFNDPAAAQWINVLLVGKSNAPHLVGNEVSVIVQPQADGKKNRNTGAPFVEAIWTAVD